jgi:hypothetical protein
MDKISVISWHEADIPKGGAPLAWWGGFFESGMRWQGYLDAFNKVIHPYLEAARTSAIANRIKVTGEQHQYDGVTPVFSDGRHFQLTYRSWGDFMASVWSEEENSDYNYMDFYVGDYKWDG